MASTGSVALARKGLSALSVLNSLDGAPTAEQRAALAGWPGWGPLAPAFDPDPQGSWVAIADQLHTELGDDAEAFNTAAECVDNSFFTPPAVIDAVYDLLATAGFTGGKVLEPGCGAGGFIARCPASWDVQFTGVESDVTSARIAAALHSGAEIIRMPLQKTALPRDFDAVIGNVPFSSAHIYDRAHPQGGDALHNYFIWRSLESVREGGYIILVTSRHTMDSHAVYRIARDWRGADFVGAVRLPTGTFHAEGTDAVTDVVILRKNTSGEYSGYPLSRRADHIVPAVGNVWSRATVHSYFAEYPEHVAGDLVATGYSQNPIEVRAADSAAAIKTAFGAVRQHILPMGRPVLLGGTVNDVVLADAEGRKEGSFHVIDGQLHKVEQGSLVRIKQSAELRALVGLRDQALELLAAEADFDAPDEGMAGQRAALLGAYTAYVTRFGPLNRGVMREGKPDPETGLPSLSWRRPLMGGFRRDPDYLTVMALEVYDSGSGAAEPAPILLRRVNRRPVRIERVDNPGEALAVSLGEGGLDLHRIAGLLGLASEDEAIAALGDLVYADPAKQGQWVTARDYLSGNVRVKLAEAEAAVAADPAYHRNVSALSAVLPADLGPLEIAVSLGVPWVLTGDIADFTEEVFGIRARVEHCQAVAAWEVEASGARSPAATTIYGTDRVNGYELMAFALNGKTPVVFDEIWDAQSYRKRKVRNTEQTLAAQDKLIAIQERFATWLWEDPERCKRICIDYNRRFNSHVARRHDGSHLTFPGMAADIELWSQQRDVVDQITSSRSTLCGHAVGGGKTKSMVCSAVTVRRFGLASKPMIVVPNHLLEQIAREARQAFPLASFLIAGKDDLAGDARKLFAARCATGDWDAVVITHAAFTSIPVLPETEMEWLEEQKSILDDHLRSGDGGNFGAKQIARRLRAFTAQMEKLRDKPTDPGAVTFEHLGVDMLLVDEAHYFKRLPIPSRMEGFSFGSSQRATDLLVKSRLLYQVRGDSPCLALFTGSPWSNTLAETFVWQTYLQPEALAEAGVEHFDTWASVFVVTEVVTEVAPDGSGFRSATRPMRVRNLPELRTMLNRVSDILSAEAMGLERPDYTVHVDVAQQSEEQYAYVQDLVERAERSRNGSSGDKRDNMLVICGDGRRVALDPRLVGVDEDSPKLTLVAARVAEVYHANADVLYPGSAAPGVLQVVFCDQGTPGDKGSQSYGRLRAEMIARGVPAGKVRWVHEAKNDKARDALFAACCDGSVSVLIGSTDKLGVGTNIQPRLRALHHADAPWRPSDLEQRDGRGLRPGNLNDFIDIYRYVTEGTFDAYMWQTLERKAVFIAQMYSVDSTVREIGDIGETVLSYTEVKALATGNPLLLEQAEAAAQVRRLRTIRAVDAQSVTAARNTIKTSEREERDCTERARRMAEAAAVLAGHPGGDVDQSKVAALAERVHSRLRNRAKGDGYTTSYYADRMTWRGLEVQAQPNKGWWALKDSRCVEVSIALNYHPVSEFDLPFSALRRNRRAALAAFAEALETWADNLPRRIERTRAAAAEAARRTEQARQIVSGYVFSRADELTAAEVRLTRIETAIAEAANEDIAA